MSLDGSEAFFYSSLTNTQGVDSQYINLNGQTGILKGVNDTIEGSSTTDDLPEGKTNLYFTDARTRGAFTGGTGIVISTGGTISNTGVLSLTGTANRISVSGSTGNITLNLPQDINISANAQFATLLLTSTLTAKYLQGAMLTQGLISANSTGTIIKLNYGGNISYDSTTNTIDTIQNIQTTSTPTFAGLTLGTISGVLKATAGTIAGSSTTDDLTEGKTNLYFTNARAQGAITAGTGISIASGVITNTAPATITGITAGTNITTSNTGGNYTINTTTNPTFGTLTISAMNSNTTNGVSLGTSAGTVGNYNAYIGTQAGTGSIGSGNVGIGYQSLAGAGSGCFGLGFTAGFNAQTNGNICIGGSTGQNLLTGSGYNIYIGGAPSSTSASYETVIGASASAPVGKGNNTCYIPNSAGLYHYIPYSINLWNNNAATVSQVEQWVLNNTAGSGIANIGTTPTITSGVLTNIPVGVYNFNITGSIYGSNQTFYPTLQYKANGGSFVKVALAMPSFGGAWTCPFSLNANIRISNAADAIRLWYDTGTPYGNTGTVPPFYSPALNYLPRYMTITFISV